MTAFIEEHRGTYGVEPMCKILQIAPSTYYDRRAIARDADLASARAKSDAALSVKIDAAWEDNRKLYGARKVWHVLRREGEDVARCTVERLMRSLGIKGVVRGKVSGAKASETLETLIYFCPRMEPAVDNHRNDSAKRATPAVVQAATSGDRTARTGFPVVF